MRRRLYFNMGDRLYTRLITRRRLCKRLILMVFTFIASFYGSILLFGDLRSPDVMHLTDLNRCPACYGVSVCPELYSNQIVIGSSRAWLRLFNAKNVYYGYTKSNRRVVLKKLAQKWELEAFDSSLCGKWGLKYDCKPIDLLNVSHPDDKILDTVHYNLSIPATKPRKGLIMCPYAYSVFDFIQPMMGKKTNSDKINIWTVLNINPEPLILQVIQKSKGWPVPSFGGVCGRLEVVAHEGEPLSALMHIPWYRKLKHCKEILEAAMDFTFKHDRYRFYLMDWSIDNIVANEMDDISFIDLEDVIILDKHISPKNDLPSWYQRYSKEFIGPGFTFSIDNLCKHHLSDHNLWAACYILAGDDSPYIYAIPKRVSKTRSHFEKLLKECLISDDRFKVVIKLLHTINDMMADKSVDGFGAVR